jgi:hypothetical protein
MPLTWYKRVNKAFNIAYPPNEYAYAHHHN